MRMVIAFFLALFLFSGALLADESTPYSKAVHDFERSQKELALTKKRIEAERKKLLSEEAALKAQVGSLKRQVELLQRSLESLRDKEQTLVQKALENDQETNELIGEFRIGAKKLRGYLVRSPFTAIDRRPFDVVESFLSKGFLPEIEDIDKLNSLYLSEMKRSGEIGLFRSTFVGKDGTMRSGDVLFIGPFTTIYRDKSGVGFLRYDETRKVLSSEVSAPSWRVKRVIEGYMEGKRSDTYLDISGGGALIRLSNRLTFSEQARRGGPIALVILILGLAAGIIVVERFLFLGGVDVKSAGLMDGIEKLARDGKWDEIKSMLSGKNLPLYRVLLSGVEAKDEDKDTLEGILQEAIMRELPRIERFLSTLSIIGAIAPLLGLLGTVTGMIKTFHVITLFGSTDPRMMSGGISEALITTEFGLMVAIPVLFLHSLISRKVDRIVDDMEEKASHLVNIILATRG